MSAKTPIAIALLLAACGGKSAPATKTETAPLAASCKDVGDRAARDIVKQVPQGLPEDAPARFGAMITHLCEQDEWPADVRECGMTAENPREECSPKLSAEKRAHIDEAQKQFATALAVQMGASVDLSASTGMASCDALRGHGAVLASCDKARAEMGAALDQLLIGLATLTEIPDEQHTEMDAQCKGAIGEMEQAIASYDCKAAKKDI